MSTWVGWGCEKATEILIKSANARENVFLICRINLSGYCKYGAVS
jgi:hypothetical protein